jgi:alkylation response protein AidB-like acyl-CoA dehydrogenase
MPWSEPELRALLALQAVLDGDIAARAAENDDRGRYPTHSIRALKRTGILHTSVPRACGGPGFSRRFSMEAQLRIAAADPSVAQIFKVHDEVTREVLVFAPASLKPLLARRILEDDAILGLAVAESGRKVDDPLRTLAIPQLDGGFQIDGQKIYTSGAAEADLIAVWAYNPTVPGIDTQPLLGLQLNLVDPATPGVNIHRDWDALGQRATDSGTITFTAVRTDPKLKANEPGNAPLPYASLGYEVGFAAILTGIAIGALRAAATFAGTTSRPWPSAGVDNAIDDPYVRRLAGELVTDLVGAYTTVLAAADQIDAHAAGKISRAAAAGPTYAAKALASRASVRASSEIFGLLGTRAAAAKHGFDRFWRDARTLSLHDPLEWKYAELGRIVMGDWDPPPGIYQ